MSTPYYLQPNITTTEKESAFDIFEATKFSYDYDYGYLPEPQGTKTAWEEIADSTTQTLTRAGDAVWDTAKGTWDTAKTGVVSALQEVRDVAGDLTESAGGFLDSLLMRILLIFAVIIGAIYLMAKSGAIKDVASILK